MLEDTLDQKGIAIAAEHVSKNFGHVHALRDASIQVRYGEVVGLCGDNGAGKSTLLRILQGIYHLDRGSLFIDDQPVTLHSVRDAQALGVDTVHQDLALAPELSVTDNMFLGHETLRTGILGRFGVLAHKEMAAKTDAALRELSIALPSLTVSVRDLSGGQRQALAVARAVMWSRSAILMDEPTAALGARQSEIVAQLIRKVAQRNLGVLVVSHDLPRLLTFADRIVVLWRGENVLDESAADLTVPDLVASMVGYRSQRGRQ